MNLELIKKEAAKFFPPKRYPFGLAFSQDDVVAFAKHCVDKAQSQPRLTVRLTSFPESNGKRNWTALLVRVDKFDGLVGNCGGITIARGEYWNRVAFEAERAKFLIGERDTEPFILDYGKDIWTPEEWAGESSTDRYKRNKPAPEAT